MSFLSRARRALPYRNDSVPRVVPLTCATLLSFGGLLSAACDVGEPAPLPRGSCEAPDAPKGTWRPIPDPELGIVAAGLAYAWSGTELLIWGEATQEDEDGHPITAAAYSPEDGTWRNISPRGVLEGGRYAGSVWTGSEWIVWGGRSAEDAGSADEYRVVAGGARFDPASGEWTPVAPSPLGGRFGFGTVWTGSEMVIWGGFDADGSLTAEDVYGAAYDPANDTWRMLNASGAPRANLNPVWTGSHMIIWGAWSEATYAAKYDPARDVWSPLTTSGAPSPSGGALWTGKEMLAFAFVAETWARYRAGAYNPLTDSWRTLSTNGAPPSSREVWAGDRVLTWGDPGDCTLVGSYDPETDVWSRLTGPSAPTPRAEAALVWTGSSLLVYGGRGGASGSELFSDGGEFIPDTP